MPFCTAKQYFSSMGRKIRRVISTLVLSAMVLSAHALSADDLVQKAMENSTTIRTLNINRENTILNRQISDVEPTMSVTISSGNVTVQKEEVGKSIFMMSPYATITLPEKNDSTLTFKLSNVTRFYKSGDSYVSFTPDVTYSKLIKLDSYFDTREDITKLSNQISQDISYQKSLIQFQNSFLQSLSAIIQSEISIKSSRLSYERLVQDRETSLASGDITPDSLKDLQSQMRVDSTRVALESLEKKHADLLKSFRENYGFDYERPDSVRDVDLSIEALESGNSTVLLSDMSLQIAKQAVDVASGTSTKLQLGANTNMTMIQTNGNDLNTTVNGSVSGTISGSNYSIGAEAGADYRSDELFPYVTIRGTWSNKKTTQTDALTLQSLQNKVILAQIDYDNAVQSYKNEVASLKSDVSNHLSDLSQFEVSSNYNRLILERTQQMYDKGIVTKRDLEDAQLSVEKDEVQAMIYKISALILENRIAALQL